ncbi:GNAT family N-acetyltransferase [Pseudomonas frederiksbergensis]|uniref:GNAT family N-acetyltransferase n=1 Tax=Pseudomonas frederiksbergensis TaxID=104087 RepID=UPI000F4820E6|nr:GNAT family N-acetyltransferase [Pseudomonas frederiksbergensis]RON51998.1 GNAT family N-acetyltransferase [Pseudomonas frederiksbergensis]
MIFRPFRASDARAISRLFRRVYGDHYVQPDVYLPKLIMQHNNDGRWQSMVAVEGCEVLGHAALIRDGHPSNSPELALIAVHPAARGQSIATRLGRELLEHANAVAGRCVLIKQVSHHPYTQRMAQTLRFHCTGLLPDYVPSPFASPLAESLVVGVHLLDGHTRPLPDIVWPDSCRGFMQHMCSVFGSTQGASVYPAQPLHMQQHKHRVDVVIERLDKRLLDQLIELPQGWMISLRLALSPSFAEDFQRLSIKGLIFTGLIPAPDHDRWFALFHRGARSRHLDLHCPHMQRLHDHLQHASRNVTQTDRSAA